MQNAGCVHKWWCVLLQANSVSSVLQVDCSCDPRLESATDAQPLHLTRDLLVSFKPVHFACDVLVSSLCTFERDIPVSSLCFSQRGQLESLLQGDIGDDVLDMFLKDGLPDGTDF
jgi:hypothetical protein